MFEDCDYDISSIKDAMILLYNMWYEILKEYLCYKGLDFKIDNYSESVKSILEIDAYVFTTNFDSFLDDLNLKHLNGLFVSNCRYWEELKYKDIDEEEFYWKILWGWNGLGKGVFINRLSKYPNYEKYFNFELLYNDSISINNFLIYGMSFQRAGYFEELSKVNNRYNKLSKGDLIDDYILIKLQIMQDKSCLGNIYFGYYSDGDLKQYKAIIECYGLKSVSYFQTSEFNFKI